MKLLEAMGGATSGVKNFACTKKKRKILEYFS